MMNTVQKAMILVLLTIGVGSCTPQRPANVIEIHVKNNDNRENIISALKSELGKGAYQIQVVKPSSGPEVFCVLDRTTGDLSVYRPNKTADRLVMIARRNLFKEKDFGPDAELTISYSHPVDQSFWLIVDEIGSKGALVYRVDLEARQISMRSIREVKEDLKR